MKRIWLIRHSQSESNAGAGGQAPANIGLTELGQRQASEIAREIQEFSALNQTVPSRILVSPYSRTSATAAPTCSLFAGLTVETTQHHELTYLSPAACLGLTHDQRKSMVEAYWSQASPDLRHGPDAETFQAFAQRVTAFANYLDSLPDGWYLVFGHGQFFAGLLQHWLFDYDGTREWMLRFRRDETASPLANARILETLSFSCEEYFTPEKMRTYVGDDESLQAKVWNAFRSSARSYEVTLQSALRSDDLAAVSALLHRVKPSVELMLRDEVLASVCFCADALRSTSSLAGAPWEVRVALAELRRVLKVIGSRE
jgi:2,3-bisphosphoglycerate-dependent phosphoglycerate mutase